LDRIPCWHLCIAGPAMASGAFKPISLVLFTLQSLYLYAIGPMSVIRFPRDSPCSFKLHSQTTLLVVAFDPRINPSIHCIATRTVTSFVGLSMPLRINRLFGLTIRDQILHDPTGKSLGPAGSIARGINPRAQPTSWITMCWASSIAFTRAFAVAFSSSSY